MGKVWDDRIEFAVEHIFNRPCKEQAEEAMKKLEEAAADGIADACFFIARCYGGKAYVEESLGFPQNFDKALEYVYRSVTGGSAIGMLGARRFGGYEEKYGLYLSDPYQSNQEVWEVVCRKAEMGDGYSCFAIALAYYYYDVFEFLPIDTENMSKQEIKELTNEFCQKSHEWAEKAVEHGCSLGAHLLFNLHSGKKFFKRDDAKQTEYAMIAAEAGVSFFQEYVVYELLRKKKVAQAIPFLQKAMLNGQKGTGKKYGMIHFDRESEFYDLNKAREGFEAELQMNEKDRECHSYLGMIYFYGGDNVTRDYEKAGEHFAQGDNSITMAEHGICQLKGFGMPKNEDSAVGKLLNCSSERLSAVGLGEAYAYGLGVKTDIDKAMRYWNQYPEDERVIEHKKNFQSAGKGWRVIDPNHIPEICYGIWQEDARGEYVVMERSKAGKIFHTLYLVVVLGLGFGLCLLGIIVILCASR